MTQTSNTVAFTVAAAPTAPSWWTDMTERTWTQVAGGSGAAETWQRGNRVTDVAPDPLPPGGDGINAIHNNWTGACSYQAGGEYLLPAQGGHDGYYGNEIYSLALREETPAYERIWGPTPTASMLTNSLGFNPPNPVHADGNPRPIHGWHTPQCSPDGKIWLPGMPSFAHPHGGWGTSVFSIARTDPMPTNWRHHGRLYTYIPGGNPDSTFEFYSGPGAYDRTTGYIWRAGGFATEDGVVRLDTATCLAAADQSTTTGPQAPGSQIYDIYLGGNPFAYAWSVIVGDREDDTITRRCWIVGSSNESKLYIMDLTAGTPSFVTRTVSGTPTGWGLVGAAYHVASGKIVLAGTEFGAQVRTLSMSTTDPLTATFTWGALTNNSGSDTPSEGYQYQGTYSKMQMIEDMGDGRSALVLMSDVTDGTYVYKLPTSF
jgi:hypothetical protein